MSNHTPGPWIKDKTDIVGVGPWLVVRDSCVIICCRSEGDANLIAAAPDLLVNCKWALEVLLHENSLEEACECSDGDGGKCLTCRIDAAIAEAEGNADRENSQEKA